MHRLYPGIKSANQFLIIFLTGTVIGNLFQYIYEEILCAGTVVIMLLATHGTGTDILALFGSLTGAILISVIILKCRNKRNAKK